ncbi:hypothetical protein GW888_00840 [Candidatus Wolfebacteria bacterium]|uniref:Uncharacterized protein n=1 Tax=Candidatus Wolfebacteria bacterium CG_4_10_14_0_2_um_filter_39_18 TaxID=1975061 RepID=A0A2M7TG32_9BACT|nr:hypothetical protein [Candidatus Wolfebacteria bacterium]NCO44604.1 hypothetical protein [Candidatus Wolfebacteria bacterium]PIZ44953.1 MAG: hypothetical protein COY31_01395 [Candidatus Wolfebacteria bacterium CG_4_10_14_0_2_um_filter_39_18]
MRVELIVFFVILAIILFFQIRKRINAKSETQQQPTKTTDRKKKRSVGWVFPVILLLLVALLGYWYHNEQVKNLRKQTRIEFQKQLQSFYLPPCTEDSECEEVPTVDAGPGTKHRIRADAPYRAVSVQPNGKRIVYNMPEGWETWTGAAPAGKLRLLNAKGAEKEILVEILREQ